MTAAKHPLARLACGTQENHGVLGHVLDVLGDTIDNAVMALAESRPFSTRSKRLLAAFYGRTLLEAVSTAILARVDPFRVLVVHAVQGQPGYDIAVRSQVAVDWANDIVGDGKAPPIDGTLTPAKFKRALLGDHYGAMFWQSAFEELLDDPDVGATTGSPWLDSMRNDFTPEGFCPAVRDSASRLFSSLSKGVHQEFVVHLNVIYDEATVTELVSDTIEHCSRIALVSHSCLTRIASLRVTEALNLFREVEGEQW